LSAAAYFSERFLGGETLLLASLSPRRAELLRLVGARFEVVAPGEEPPPGPDSPEAEVIRLARAKAGAVAEAHPERWVLAADTLVFQDGELLGKPRETSEARGMLRRLQGTWHEVFTGICLARSGRLLSAAERSRVRFAAMSAADIDAYVRTGEPLDKAGAYGIQGFGALWVDRIEGCYFNVMGLPLPRLAALARQAAGSAPAEPAG